MNRQEAYEKIIKDQCYRRCTNSEPYPNCIADGCEYYIALENLLNRKDCEFVFDEMVQDYRCSVCGHFTAGEYDMEDEYFEVGDVKGWALRMPHYCKHCGARADKERLTKEDYSQMVEIAKGV